MPPGPQKRRPDATTLPRWGETPWIIDFHPPERDLPEEVDFAVIGGGFTGLAAAAWTRRCDPTRSVAVFEAEAIGAGASGHTGGLALAETAAGDLPGLGDVLAGFSNILQELRVDCDLTLPGVWEVGRDTSLEASPISWNDSGTLRVARQVPGGTVDPGKLLTGLARAAEQRGALIYECARVEEIGFGELLTLTFAGRQARARHVLIATNAFSLELGDLADRAQPKLTLALATNPLSDSQLQEIGLAAGKPFYTVDFPYLWGRLIAGNRVVFGSGLVDSENWRDLYSMDVNSGPAGELLKKLEKRVRRLHPALVNVEACLRWGGPILIADEWQPVFNPHPKDARAIVLGAYSGHGVALSSYLGAWAAEVMLGRKQFPEWARSSGSGG
jgi:gamma-glutamylputrescine oxidase